MITPTLRFEGVLHVRYLGVMELPEPTLQIDISEYQDRAEEILAAVDAGGAVVVFDDERDRIVGVLSRAGWSQDEALLARDIASGRLPSLDELSSPRS